ELDPPAVEDQCVREPLVVRVVLVAGADVLGPVPGDASRGRVDLRAQLEVALAPDDLPAQLVVLVLDRRGRVRRRRQTSQLVVLEAIGGPVGIADRGHVAWAVVPDAPRPAVRVADLLETPRAVVREGDRAAVGADLTHQPARRIVGPCHGPTEVVARAE